MHFILRPWRVEDIPCVTRYANNPRIAENLRDTFPFPYTKEDSTAYIAKCMAADEGTDLFRAIEVDGQAVGSICLMRGSGVYRKNAELGYWLAEPFWGRGIMSQAAIQFCNQGFSTWDLLRIFAEVYTNNSGSRRVLEKVGFALEGIMRHGAVKNEQAMDCCMYAKLATE